MGVFCGNGENEKKKIARYLQFITLKTFDAKMCNKAIAPPEFTRICAYKIENGITHV